MVIGLPLRYETFVFFQFLVILDHLKSLLMKTILTTIFLSLTLTSFSQSLTFPQMDSKSFTWKGGNDEFCEVVFKCLVKSDTITDEVLSNIVMNIMVKSKYELKNKYSFVPKEVMIYDNKEGGYSGYSKYVGKNGYGSEGLLNSYFDISKEGEVELLFTKDE